MAWYWYWCFNISVLLLAVSVVFSFIRAKSRYKTGRILNSTNILFIGVISAAVALFIPIYANAFSKNDCGVIETVFIAVHNMIRLFIVDGDFNTVTDNLEGVTSTLYKSYTVLLSILFVLAPVLTFKFALSFFKNLSANISYFWHFKSNVYIFSELNEKSLALANSLYNHDKKNRFVFTCVFDGEKEQNSELVEKAKELGAICFKKDMASINFAIHSKKSELSFFAFCEDEQKNVTYAINTIERYKYRENANLYVSASKPETEMIITGEINKIDGIKIKVRRINDIQSLILNNLYENGYEEIFTSAYDDGSDIKKINAVVIGMGKYGTEMVKGLSWFCQMDGYLLELDAFDISADADEKFIAQCPELMALSGNDIEGESRYTINLHPKTDVYNASFEEALLSLPRTTYVFVSLGDDEKNIYISIKLRALFERRGYDTRIQTVINNSEKKEALTGIANFKGQEYKIDFIGDIRSFYSREVVLNCAVEDLALARHKNWGDEVDFWKYNYNYKSSMASAIHRKMKELCGIPGINVPPEQRTQEELWGIRILEHRRWNAYMRSEGYVYGGTTEKSGRNDLAKQHNCLVRFSELPLKEQEKDDD